MWRQGQTHHPYTLSLLGKWGHGEYSLGCIDVETGTDTPPLYTLISGDVGTRGVFSRIYTYGDRRQKHNQLGIVCFTFSKKSFLKIFHLCIKRLFVMSDI